MVTRLQLRNDSGLVEKKNQMCATEYVTKHWNYFKVDH